MICNRCHKEIEEGKDESCWWCIEPLCYECWDDYGHCGHKEAEKMNEDARKVPQPPTVKDFGIVPDKPTEMWIQRVDGRYYRSNGLETSNPSWDEETDLETIERLKQATPIRLSDIAPPVTPGDVYGSEW